MGCIHILTQHHSSLFPQYFSAFRIPRSGTHHDLRLSASKNGWMFEKGLQIPEGSCAIVHLNKAEECYDWGLPNLLVVCLWLTPWMRNGRVLMFSFAFWETSRYKYDFLNNSKVSSNPGLRSKCTRENAFHIWAKSLSRAVMLIQRLSVPASWSTDALGTDMLARNGNESLLYRCCAPTGSRKVFFFSTKETQMQAATLIHSFKVNFC